MRRRELLLLLTTSMIGARTVCAQQKAMPVIGFLSSRSAGESEPNLAAFHRGLSETGYVDGQNAAIEYRWAGSAMTNCCHWLPTSSAATST